MTAPTPDNTARSPGPPPVSGVQYPEEVLRAEWNPDLEQVSRVKRRRTPGRCRPVVLVSPQADWTECLPEPWGQA